MARNDTILIDGILDDRVAQRLPSARRDEAFEYFAFEQILRDADLSKDEIVAGSIDGRDDGGIDGFFIIVNGHPLFDPDVFVWPRSGCELDLWIITCKHRDTFRQAPLDNLVASLTELLDLGLSNPELKGAYSEALLKARSRLLLAYRKVSPRLTHFGIHFAYASRGDATAVGDSIEKRGDQAVATAEALFGNCQASFTFVGAAELITMHRRVRTFSLELPFLEALSRGERYVLLCRLTDFCTFVSDEAGKLRRYLFDSNVRAFMGLNRVNEDIQDTLNNSDSPDFWWLNNGITILANTATVTGKSIQLEGVQIVNGLQTTESLSRYFADGKSDPKERAVLIKIIVSTDSAIRDAIIRATNNQTAVSFASLHATDKVQRDIDDVLLRAGIFYERRTNYYANLGYPADRIVTPMYLAAGYVALVLKCPGLASSLRPKFMRIDESYARVFSDKAPLAVWPVIVGILKKTDVMLETFRPIGTAGNERFLKRWRQITAFLAVSRIFGRFSFSAAELGGFDINSLTDELLTWSWNYAKVTFEPKLHWGCRKSRRLTVEICHKAAAEFSIRNPECVDRPREPIRVRYTDSRSPHLAERPPVSPQFLAQVDAVLPEQPWKPGAHHVVAKILGVHSLDVSNAIQQLIAAGRRHQQKDGVVYSADGSILAVDRERVPEVNEGPVRTGLRGHVATNENCALRGGGGGEGVQC